MKPAKTEKISGKDLREPPAWLKEARKRFQNSPLGRMSEKEIGQYCEELAERAAKKRKVDPAEFVPCNSKLKVPYSRALAYEE